MASVIARDPPLLWLPMYYLQPHEIVALAMGMGEKRWDKCVDEGRKRNHPLVKAVAYGAEIRGTLRRPEHIPELRPPPEWLAEARINPGSLKRALEAIAE